MAITHRYQNHLDLKKYLFELEHGCPVVGGGGRGLQMRATGSVPRLNSGKKKNDTQLSLQVIYSSQINKLLR